MLASFDEESDLAGNLPYSGVARIGLQSIVAYDKHALFDENLSNLTSAHSDADRFELRSGKKMGTLRMRQNIEQQTPNERRHLNYQKRPA